MGFWIFHQQQLIFSVVQLHLETGENFIRPPMEVELLDKN